MAMRKFRVSFFKLGFWWFSVGEKPGGGRVVGQSKAPEVSGLLYLNQHAIVNNNLASKITTAVTSEEISIEREGWHSKYLKC